MCNAETSQALEAWARARQVNSIAHSSARVLKGLTRGRHLIRSYASLAADKASWGMMKVDYEKEYDTRGRVPEFPAIMGRIAEDSKNYSAAATAAGRSELGVSYGPSPRQIVDIFWSAAGKSAPVAVFVHGGYWLALQPAIFSQVAAGLNGHEVTVVLPRARSLRRKMQSALCRSQLRR